MSPSRTIAWSTALPPARWLSTYRSEWLARDAIAGVTLAAYGIPVALAYASLAGLPPEAGIYCYLAGGGDGFFSRLTTLAGQLGETNVTVLIFGLAALAVLWLGDRLLPGRPVPLLVVAAAIALLSLTPLGARGFSTVGELPRGLPAIHAPALRPADVDGVVPLALACFLLSYIESVSAARALAERSAEEIDPRQELIGLAAANLAVAFVGGFPVAGGLSQSSVNDKAGARTPLALVVASATIGVCLIFLTGLLRNLPTVILASIVLLAVVGLIDVARLRELWRISRSEFAIAMVALVAVLAQGILRGVLFAAIASVLMLLHRAARPHVAFLGRIPGTNRYSDLARHESNQPIPGALLCRIESSLVYFNAEHVRDSILARLHDGAPVVRLVVIDLSATPYVDVSSGRMLGALQATLAARGAELRLVEARGGVRDFLRRAGLSDSLGKIDRRRSLDDVVTEFTQRTGPSPGESPS